MSGVHVSVRLRDLRKGGGAGYTLVEMLVVVLIVGSLLALGAGMFNRTGSEAVKTGSEKFTAMVEQARTSAITRRKPVALAIFSPGDTQDGLEACRLGLFSLEEWESGEPVVGELIQRWQGLPGGVGFAGGEYESLENIMDTGKVSISWKNGSQQAEVPMLIFSARGGLLSPGGSKPVIVTIASGVHQRGEFILRNGGGRRIIRVGRVVARPWMLDV